MRFSTQMHMSPVSRVLRNSQNRQLQTYPKVADDSSFTVRRAKSLEDLKFTFDIANDENWGLAHGDAECFFTADPQGYFIGELVMDGKKRKISTQGLIKYPKNKVCVGGLSTTDPAYRKMGYARKLIKSALRLQCMPNNYSLQTDSIIGLVPYFMDVSGFRWYLGWINYCTIIPAVQALDALRLIPPVRSTNVITY